MAQYDFNDLRIIYEHFSHPFAVVTVDGKDIADNGAYAIIGVEVSLSSGYEAGIATIDIADCYNREIGRYETDEIKKRFALGKMVEIALGYGINARNVFKGFISQISFKFQENDVPFMQLTCMDIKGIMMCGNFNKQLQAKDYSGAVKEIFEKSCMKAFTEDSIYKLSVTDTPDHKEQSGEEEVTAFSVEMVNETDYEFVVRAAKKFNYEFFCVGGDVLFRKARDARAILMEIGTHCIVTNYNIAYNITGLARNLEVRGVNPDKGEVIIGKRALKQTISNGSKADALLKESQYILQDATVNSDDDATARLDYLENEISNRFARLDLEMIGIPELIPGRFIELSDITDEISKKFYLKRVTHKLVSDRGYRTRIEGSAPSLSDWN